MRQYRPAIPKTKPIARTFDNRVVQPERKSADAVYTSPAYVAWRKIVVTRAGYRCQAVDDGRRCTKAAPEHRLFADHIRELNDGGAIHDPANGQCLCGSHHTVKTWAARARRLGQRG